MVRVELIQVDLSDSGPAGLHPVQPLLIWRIFVKTKGDSNCGLSQERGCIYSECSLFKDPSSTFDLYSFKLHVFCTIKFLYIISTMADVASLTFSETTHSNGTNHANGDSQTNGDLQDAFVDRVATSANTPELVPGLVDQVASLGKVASLQDHTDRTTLLEAARSLVYALETPREAMIRYCWSQVCSHAPRASPLCR